MHETAQGKNPFWLAVRRVERIKVSVIRTDVEGAIRRQRRRTYDLAARGEFPALRPVPIQRIHLVVERAHINRVIPANNGGGNDVATGLEFPPFSALGR